MFNIGDRISYDNGIDECLQGEVVDFMGDDDRLIHGYFVILDSGEYIQIRPENLKWCRLDDSVLIP